MMLALPRRMAGAELGPSRQDRIVQQGVDSIRTSLTTWCATDPRILTNPYLRRHQTDLPSAP